MLLIINLINILYINSRYKINLLYTRLQKNKRGFSSYDLSIFINAAILHGPDSASVRKVAWNRLEPAEEQVPGFATTGLRVFFIIIPAVIYIIVKLQPNCRAIKHY